MKLKVAEFILLLFLCNLNKSLSYEISSIIEVIERETFKVDSGSCGFILQLSRNEHKDYKHSIINVMHNNFSKVYTENAKLVDDELACVIGIVDVTKVNSVILSLLISLK